MAVRVQIVEVDGDGAESGSGAGADVAVEPLGVTDEAQNDGEELTERLTARDALADLLAVLRLCAVGKLRCSEKTSRPSAATVTAVAEVLRHGDFYVDDPIAAFAWPLLLQAGGLAEIVGGRLTLTAKGRAALTKPPAETIRLLWKRWLSHALLDEMSRIEEIKGQRSARALTAAGPRRKAVGEALAMHCALSEWMPVDLLFGSMITEGPQFGVARDLWKLYLDDREYGSLGYDGHHGWTLLEGRYTLCLLFEYAGTLGLFDLRYGSAAGARDDFRDNWGADWIDCLSRYDGLAEIRLNRLGAYVLGLSDRYEPDAAAGEDDDRQGEDDDADDILEPIKVLPSLDVVVTGRLVPSEELLLDAFARRRSERVWALSLASLLVAIEQGRQPEELRAFLTSRAAVDELPAAVRTLFVDATGRSGQLRDLGYSKVVECADPALAALIGNDRKLRAVCQRIGDRHLAVSPEREADFRAAVRKLGYALPL
ncbi:helicase-associated domain-containing protein [Pseudofrankia sp. BMG5.36]|uniref:helicase-associated domain-containing protein n=1 Tax=Pseudofrankia sp. BMG5.36 TaxID=1834512 RepID=UPI0009F1DB29|nr:helicase-associated domain-containing protein [Pseudofrankia sp. BMG5.36]